MSSSTAPANVPATLPMLVAGDWSTTDATVPNINPSDTRDVVTQATAATAADVARAIDAARSAQPAWAAAGVATRSEVLYRAATEIADRREELGALLAREEGKPIGEAIGEALRASQVLRFFAGEAVRLSGDAGGSVRPGVEVLVEREPVGVVAAITPWNFPLAIPAWKLGPTLAFGNAMLLKPATLVPACAWALVDILVRAGVPAGVIALLPGPGRVIGDALLSPGGVDAVSFTGSVETGAGIARRAGELQIRCQLEMGGKNPLVVAADADLDIAVDCALQGAFFSTGQRCTASSRLVVVDEIHDAFVERLLGRLGELPVGAALDPATRVGPVVDETQLRTDLDYVAIGVAEGATLAYGGQTVERDTPGHYLEPALFTGATNAMRIAREEIFGPVAAVIRVGSYDEAVAVANDTEMGLSSGIVTTSLKLASDFRRRARSGMVMVNLPTAGVDYHAPFGGTRGSSFGPREQGPYAREMYTTLKTTYIAP